MFRWLGEVLKARREAVARRQYKRGFEYAAGALLRGVAVDDLDAEMEFDFGPSAFDAGMEAAIADWGQHMPPSTSIVWPKIAA